jgi:membrane protein implicated in regulation of membrane protease activity
MPPHLYLKYSTGRSSRQDHLHPTNSVVSITFFSLSSLTSAEAVYTFVGFTDRKPVVTKQAASGIGSTITVHQSLKEHRIT